MHRRSRIGRTRSTDATVPPARTTRSPRSAGLLGPLDGDQHREHRHPVGAALRPGGPARDVRAVDGHRDGEPRQLRVPNLSDADHGRAAEPGDGADRGDRGQPGPGPRVRPQPVHGPERRRVAGIRPDHLGAGGGLRDRLQLGPADLPPGAVRVGSPSCVLHLFRVGASTEVGTGGRCRRGPDVLGRGDVLDRLGPGGPGRRGPGRPPGAESSSCSVSRWPGPTAPRPRAAGSCSCRPFPPPSPSRPCWPPDYHDRQIDLAIMVVGARCQL